MKKWRYLIIALILVAGMNSFKGEKEASARVYDSFSFTGAEFLRMDTEAHSNIYTDESEEEVAASLFKGLGYEGNYSISKENEMTNLIYREDEIDIVIKTRKLNEENLTYASVTLSHNSMNKNIINSIRGTIDMAFGNFKARPSFSTLISGKYSERLTISQMKDRASSILKSAGASFVSGMDEGNLVSISGFTRTIKEKIKMENKYINLNVALRYSEISDCTYIWIGSPIISVEY